MGREGRTRWSAPTRRGIGLSRGRWVKGAQAGWKAGPTRRACPTGGGGLRWSAQSCGPRRQSWRRLAIGTPVLLGIVSLCRRDRRHGKPGGLLHFGGGGLKWSAQSCVPRRQSWRRMALELPYCSGLCGSAGATAGMASLAACSTLRRRLQVERAVVRATPPVLAAVGDWNSRTARDCVALSA